MRNNRFVHPAALSEGEGAESTETGAGQRSLGIEKRPRGRPRKIEDSIALRQFGRLAKVTSAYDQSREKGAKHSVAVSDVVDTFRQRSPKLRISETGVKRILSTYRPRGSEKILRFDRLPWSEGDKKKYNAIREQSAAFAEKEGITVPQLPVYDETRRREKFLLRFSERPDYPRHNRKSPNG